MKNETKMSAEKVVKEPKPKLMSIKLEKLHPFEDHPYKVLDDESMTELTESKRMRTSKPHYRSSA